MMGYGVFTYACPMPPQDAAPWIPYPVPYPMPYPGPLPQPETNTPPVPTDWSGPSIEDDLAEAERLFGCALRRIRAAIAKHRAKEGTP